jgi:hypothetical protein
MWRRVKGEEVCKGVQRRKTVWKSEDDREDV